MGYCRPTALVLPLAVAIMLHVRMRRGIFMTFLSVKIFNKSGWEAGAWLRSRAREQGLAPEENWLGGNCRYSAAQGRRCHV